MVKVKRDVQYCDTEINFSMWVITLCGLHDPFRLLSLLILVTTIDYTAVHSDISKSESRQLMNQKISGF